MVSLSDLKLVNAVGQGNQAAIATANQVLTKSYGSNYKQGNRTNVPTMRDTSTPNYTTPELLPGFPSAISVTSSQGLGLTKKAVANPNAKGSPMYKSYGEAANAFLQTPFGKVAGALEGGLIVAASGGGALAVGAGAFLAPPIARGLISNPDVIPSAVNSIGNLQTTLGNIASKPGSLIGEALDFARDNKVTTGLLALLAGGTALKLGAGQVIGGLLNREAVSDLVSEETKRDKKKDKEDKAIPSNDKLPSVAGDNSSTKGPNPSPVPITPQRQIVGKAAGTKRKGSRTLQKKKAQAPAVRVNIYNQSSLNSNRYLNYRR